MEVTKLTSQCIRDRTEVTVDLIAKDLTLGGKQVISRGELCDEYTFEYPHKDTAVALEELKSLYHKYKFSVPTERSGTRYRKYFPAVPLDKLADKWFVVATNREQAQAELEVNVLFNVLSGNLKWDDNYGKWFYKDGDFILMKSWF